MARTAVAAAQLVALNNPEQVVQPAADARDLAFVDSDSTNGMQFAASGRDLVIVKNNGVGVNTVTFDAAADGAGRDGKIDAYSLGAGEEAWFGLFDTAVWRQSDGMVWVDMSADDVQIIVFRLP